MSYYIPAIHISKNIIDHNVSYEQLMNIMNNSSIISKQEVQYWHTNDNRILRINLTMHTKEYYSEILHYSRHLTNGYIITPTIKPKSIFRLNGKIIRKTIQTEIECMNGETRITCIIVEPEHSYIYKIYSECPDIISRIINQNNSALLSP
jgi:hypothetical protein